MINVYGIEPVPTCPTKNGGKEANGTRTTECFQHMLLSWLWPSALNDHAGTKRCPLDFPLPPANIAYHARMTVCLLLCLLFSTLSACRSTEREPSNKAVISHDEVILSPSSPKWGYISESVVQPTQRPLMDPVNAKLVYDETHTVRISSPVSGRVHGKILDLGTRVAVGDALVGLDSPELGQAQADYAGAVADLNIAVRALQRTQELYDNKIAPKKDLELAQETVARLSSATDRARLLLANLGVKTKGTNNHFDLKAPIAGIITERNVNPGMEVKPDLSAPLFVISDLSRLWVMLDIFEKDIGLIQKGGRVIIKVPAYPSTDFTATVDYIGQVVSEDTHTIKVRCILPNPDDKLLPSMYASALIQSNPDDLGIVVPLGALFTEGESDWLFVSAGNGRYLKRPVTVGLRLKDRAVILEGLQAGESVVVKGGLLLRMEQDQELQTGEVRQ
jgi:membrane fusion protein, heavy metal efflux system